jgi:hypothetical protein
LRILYVCDAWPLTLTEEHRLTLNEDRNVEQIDATKEHELIVGGENKVTMSLTILTVHRIG